MNILCTGGAGYVGSACVRYLVARGHSVTVYDNLSGGSAAAVPGADERLVRGDIRDSDSLSRVIRSRGIEAVMHFAALVSVSESVEQPDEYWEVNLVGTKRLLDVLRDCGVKRVVFSSTAAVYAPNEGEPLVETSLTRPINPYGETKLAAEQLMEGYREAYGLGFRTLRYFNASGADVSGEFGEDREQESHLIPLALQAAIGKRPSLSVFGKDWGTRDGTCVRDYVHVSDIAQAHALCLQSLEPGTGATYNLGNSRGTSVLEVIAACERTSGRKLPWSFAPRRAGDPATLVASSARIQADLGWRPEHPEIGAIVESAHRWHQRYPNGYAEKDG